MRASSKASIVILILIMAGAEAAMGQVFVDPINGSDVAGGGAQNAPFQTIGYALSHPSMPFDIKLKRGTYNESVVIDRDVSLVGLGPGVILTPPGPGGTALTITDSNGTISSATKIMTIEFEDCDIGILIEGTPGGGGVSPQLCHLSFDLFQQAIEIDIQNSVFNDMAIEFCSASSGMLMPIATTRGILARSITGDLQLSVNACTFSILGVGIECLGLGGTLTAFLDNLVINNFERGIAIDGGTGVNPPPLVIVRYATIVDDFPAGGFNTNAIEIGSTANATVTVENSILWLFQFNNDPLEGVGFTVQSTLSSDMDDVLLDPSNTMIPAQGVGLGGPLNYQILPGSIAIDTANPTSSLPSSNTPLATDRLGVPRFSDGNRTGTLLPDRGAFEFSPVAMDIVSRLVASPVALNLTPLHTVLPVGRFYFVIGSSNAPSASPDIAAVSVDLPNSTNVFLPSPFEEMGNLLVLPTTTLPLPLATSPNGSFHGVIRLMAPGVSAAGTEFDFQAGFFSTDPNAAGVGNFSRRVRVEFR